MKIFPQAVAAFLVVLLGMLASGSAMAQHRGHGYGHGHGGNVRFGISVGVPFYAPGFYPAPYYAYPAPAYVYPAPAYAYPAAVVGASSPPVYVEQGTAQMPPPPAQAQGDWYYCASAQAYYPHVRECPDGWQRVPAQLSSR